MEKQFQFKKVATWILVAVIVLFVAVLALGSFSTVDEGYIGVKYQFGRIVDDSLQPGLQFKIPFIQQIQSVDIREQVYELDTTTYTKDTQTVESVKVKLNYLYDKSQLSSIIRNIGIQNVESKLIIPQVQSILKNEIGQIRAEELIQNRSTIQNAIQEALTSSLGESGIIVSSFAIENIDFENGFEEAVRAKVVAEQDALKMQNKTKEKEEEAKQVVIEAEAQAEATRAAADAEAYSISVLQEQIAKSPDYIELEKIKKWDGKYPQVMGNDVNPFVTLDGSSSSSGE